MNAPEPAVEPEDVWVPVEGDARLHTWVFRPPRGAGPHPAITMAHGFGGLKDRGLRRYAERFAAAGFVVAVHDHRGFGRSEGEPRGDIDPWRQMADWRRVVSYLETREDVDTDRIGLWGSSYAGGHALVLGATDRRLKAVVAQVPTIDGHEQGLRRVPGDQRAALEQAFDDDERAQLRGEPPATQLMNSVEPGVQAAYHSPAVDEYHRRFPLPEGVDPSEHITLRSTRRAQMYEPGLWVDRVAPTPLLMVIGTHDTTTLTELGLAAYERALEPKSLTLFDGTHWQAYVEAFETTSGAAVDWFLRHLHHRKESSS